MMKIDTVIELLNVLKQGGVTDVVIAHWTASNFGLRENDADWPGIAEDIMDKDWSRVNDAVDAMAAESIDAVAAEE
jgi:hypothetical protein